MSSVLQDHREPMESTEKQEPEYEAESMATANKLIDKLRKDLNRIQNVAKECIVGIDAYQNSLRRSDDVEVLKQDEKKLDDDVVDNDTVLELADTISDNGIELDMGNLAGEIKSALAQTIGESVRSEMRSSMNHMRGRVD